MTKTTTVELPPNDILAWVKPRNSLADIRKGVREGRKHHRSILNELADRQVSYRDGLPAEQQSLSVYEDNAKNRLAVARSVIRGHICSRKGRRIELAGLLCQRDKEGKPIWAIVDPRFPISRNNGYHDSDGTIGWDGRGGPTGGSWYRYAPPSEQLRINTKAFQPAGLPPLPAKVRRIINDPKIQKRACRIGILYMPDSWVEVNPDPALVVEWKDRPGEYYALAVWGADKPRIMEFVH
jgi:hypothetical protein